MRFRFRGTRSRSRGKTRVSVWRFLGSYGVRSRSMLYGPAANADTDTSKTPFLELTLLFDIRY